MKNLKTLGLAAAAACALIALSGGGSAPATVLCKVCALRCPPAQVYPVGTTITSTLKPGTSVVFRETLGKVLLTCTSSTMGGKVTNKGGVGVPVSGHLEGLGLTGCSEAFAPLTNGTFEIHHTGPNTEGKTTLKETKVKLTSMGMSCVYTAGGGVQVGLFTSGESATESPPLDVFAVLTKLEGGAFCPPDVVWEGAYVTTSPKPLYFKSKMEGE